MSQISLSEFKRLAALTLRSLAPDPGPIEAADHARLRNDPSLLYQMFKENVFERGVLLEAQADHLQRVTRDELDFERALTYIFEPDLQDAAFDWLCGNPVDQAVLSRLGISEISLLDRCRSGLQLLTFICDRAGSPLILILDQAEKFLLAEDGAQIRESSTVLHSLVEAIPDLGGMFVVISNNEAWSELPPDLRQRFGNNEIVCEPVEPATASQLLGLYIAATYGRDLPLSYVAPWPLSREAVLRLLRNSGGNLRRMLQLAWQAFEDLPPGRTTVDESDVPENFHFPDRLPPKASSGVCSGRSAISSSIRSWDSTMRSIGYEDRGSSCESPRRCSTRTRRSGHRTTCR